jgi:hypothetical protein
MTGARDIAVGFVLALALAGAIRPAVADEKYEFDASQYEKKALELNGFLEFRPGRFALDTDSAFYKLNFAGQPTRENFNRVNGSIELSGIYRLDPLSFNFLARGITQHDYTGGEDTGQFLEGYLSWQVGTGATLAAGKKAPHWGKGYAWNPAAFLDRQKDPNDPDLSREGFGFAGAELVKSLDGPLRTVAFSAMVVPTSDSMNNDFGPGTHANPAAKLYLLYNDTDIDFMVLGQGARAARYGMDFSRNITPSFEVHGEWARILGQTRLLIGENGQPGRETGNTTSYLVGLRYLTESDTTWIAEYYHNGGGYSEAEMDRFYAWVDRAAGSGSDALVRQARDMAAGSYAQPNPMRDYAYLRISQKDPFDQLYWTPAVTIIANTADRSYSIAPEIAYAGIANLEVRLRAMFLRGDRSTDFGERQYDWRLELRARYYF